MKYYFYLKFAAACLKKMCCNSKSAHFKMNSGYNAYVFVSWNDKRKNIIDAIAFVASLYLYLSFWKSK